MGAELPLHHELGAKDALGCPQRDAVPWDDTWSSLLWLLLLTAPGCRAQHGTNPLQVPKGEKVLYFRHF